MNTYSLSIRPLSQDDIATLTELFVLAFDHLLDNQYSIHQSEHLRALREIVGLGFTASLVDRSLLSIYQYYLTRFLVHAGDYKSHPQAKITIAQTTAEMIGTAAISFSALKCPRYYEDFIRALSFTLTRWTGREADVQSILSKLGMSKIKSIAYKI